VETTRVKKGCLSWKKKRKLCSEGRWGEGGEAREKRKIKKAQESKQDKSIMTRIVDSGQSQGKGSK